MVLSPTFGVRNVHLVAQNIPDHSRLLTSAKRVHRRHAAKTIKHLVMRQRSTIATTKHLFK